MSISSDFSYGPRIDTHAAATYLRRLFTRPARAVPPICLWGEHGIGKTELVRRLAAEEGWPLRVISPAQFEETGDLIGLPFLERAEDGTQRSRFAAPEWVPRQAGPGIFLIDDFNRADDRILRALMGLWQERRLSSWRLPDDWYILMTGNPARRNYSVTTLDEAMLTRMLHLEIIFDLDAWVAWAEAEGLPQRAIAFVRRHPEVIDGRQTTARTLTFLFRLWQAYGEPADDDSQLELLTRSAVAPAAAAAFVRFIRAGGVTLPTAEALLTADTTTQTDLLARLTAGDFPDLAGLGDLSRRVLDYLERHRPLPEPEAEGLERFLLNDRLPAEQRLLLLHGISAQGHPVLGHLLRQPRLSRIVLSDH